MKRRTKAIVFFASMALTVGSLMALIGSRHHLCHENQNRCMQSSWHSQSMHQENGNFKLQAENETGNPSQK